MPAEQELDRFGVVGDDGSWLTVVEFRLVRHRRTARGERLDIGARAWRLSSGEPLLVVDAETFIVRPTGEQLRRLPQNNERKQT